MQREYCIYFIHFLRRYEISFRKIWNIESELTWHINSRGLSCALRIWSSSLSLLSHFTCLTPSGQPFLDILTPTSMDTSRHLSGMENWRVYGFRLFTWATSIPSPQRSTITDTLSSGRNGSFNRAIIRFWPWKKTFFFKLLFPIASLVLIVRIYSINLL